VPSPYGPDDSTIYWTANYTSTAAEANDILVRFNPVLTDSTPVGIRFNDLRRHPITAGFDCRSLGISDVLCWWPCPITCEVDGPRFAAADVKLGPGDDAFHVSRDVGLPPIVWVDGGAGSDLIYGASSDTNLPPDRLSGGPGSDTLVATHQFTEVSCGSGVDTLIWATASTPLHRPSTPDCEIVLPKR
jgi:Ca2+-binding RTX toxin-like protein